jgi:hypothetical protein
MVCFGSWLRGTRLASGQRTELDFDDSGCAAELFDALATLSYTSKRCRVKTLKHW